MNAAEDHYQGATIALGAARKNHAEGAEPHVVAYWMDMARVEAMLAQYSSAREMVETQREATSFARQQVQKMTDGYEQILGEIRKNL